MAPWRAKQSEPESREWSSVTTQTVGRWPHLTPAEKERILQQAATFSAGRRWEGLDGLEITDTMRAIVSVHACLLTVNIGLGVLDDVTAVLIDAGGSRGRTKHVVGGSMISESEATIIGQSALHGPVKLSWEHAFRDLESTSGTSVVIHEFAHKVDMADGRADGSPPIHGHDRSREFEAVMSSTLEALRSGARVGPIRDYGATNRSELFAVATEAFFLKPRDLERQFANLYGELAFVYRQEP